jgi:hypothetical protein
MAAHGEGAEKFGHAGREYWSRRLRGMWNWGRIAKAVTHRRERAQRKREARMALIEAEKDGDRG